MNVTEMYGINPPTVIKYAKEVACVNPELVVGLELETENCFSTIQGSDLEDAARRANISIETDGSLRGNAYEFITRPMETRHALAALTDFFAATKYNDINYSDRCSIHVHVNCTNLELEAISSLSLLYTVFEDILFGFVGNNRDSNIYCIPWNQCRMHFDLIQRFLSGNGEVLRNWSKYTALNLIPLGRYGTVEFRQMHGTADMGKITQWVNIIGAMFKEASATELNVLIPQIRELNTTSQYEAFFNRCLGSQLVYNEVYRQKMEEGVIFAKMALINMSDKTKIKPKVEKKSKSTLLQEIYNQPMTWDRETAEQFPQTGSGLANWFDAGTAVNVRPPLVPRENPAADIVDDRSLDRMLNDIRMTYGTRLQSEQDRIVTRRLQERAHPADAERQGEF